jgi:MFS family permease
MHHETPPDARALCVHTACLGLGLQQVMLPWLVAGELRASAEWVGLVQTANMLPGLVLLLVGGAVADRRDPRSLLTLLHVLATVPPLALATAIGWDGLSITVVVLCAFAMGSLNAFSNPARDSLLSEVAGSDVARAVTGLTIAQFGSQGVGMLVAGAARWAGLVPVLAAQASVVLVGALLSRRIPRRTAPPPRHGPGLAEFLVGLRFVLGSPLRAVLALTCGIGLLFSASYNVVLPVLVRDARVPPELVARLLPSRDSKVRSTRSVRFLRSRRGSQSFAIRACSCVTSRCRTPEVPGGERPQTQVQMWIAVDRRRCGLRVGSTFDMIRVGDRSQGLDSSEPDLST